MKVIQNALLYNKMSVTIKEYKEVPLSQRSYSLLETASDPRCTIGTDCAMAMTQKSKAP